MTGSSADLELAIELPLGVIANQLVRMEADLRFLNMKALAYTSEREGGVAGAGVVRRLEQINESLEHVRALVSAFEADLQPRSVRRASVSGKPLSEQDD
jgi:hypothetical protein